MAAYLAKVKVLRVPARTTLPRPCCGGLAEGGLMAPLRGLGAGHNGWRVAASCVPMLAGAVTLMLVHRCGVAFVILFASCTLLLVLLVSSTG